MANDEVLGPRKTMFVLVIVVGCFAVLWPRILSPFILGSTSDQLKPNKFDRDAGCCEVIFESEVAVLELVDAVCSSAMSDGKFSIQSVSECRKAVNDTCGLDIAAFLKRSANVGKSTKLLVENLRNTNSSCLRTNFGVPVYSVSSHFAGSWQEKGTPPIPGMRPPLGGHGGHVPAPKSSMGFVMPIYTICIIIFFVYTLSKILFKRTGSPYDPVQPDPQFRRRVFRDDSRTTPDKLGDEELAELRARLMETERAMQRIVGQLAQRNSIQENQDSTRPYTNGTILHNSGPVQIVTSEYQEAKEETPELQKEKEISAERKTKETISEPEESNQANKSDISLDENIKKGDLEIETVDSADSETKSGDIPNDEAEIAIGNGKLDTPVAENETDIKENENLPQNDAKYDLDEPSEETQPDLINEEVKSTEDLLNEERKQIQQEDESTQELLEEAIKEDAAEDKESQSVKVVGMETTAHPADGGAWRAEPPRVVPPKRPHESEPVQSIFLETDIPQQSRVLVTDFEDKQQASKDASLVVSGKITLSLIQDAPRETPDRDLESQDDFTTASAATHPAEKEEELSDEEIEEEIEIEEIEEEVEEEEEDEPKKTNAN